jgi:hypothetical protein
LYNYISTTNIHRQAKEFFIKKSASGGTKPTAIVSALVSMKIDYKKYHMILITDGEIEVDEIDRCDEGVKRNNIDFAFVTVFIVGRNIATNLSIQAAFCRNCGSRVVTLKDDKLYKEVEPEVQVSVEDQRLLNEVSKINTYEELTKLFDGLLRALTARMIGSKGDK